MWADIPLPTVFLFLYVRNLYLVLYVSQIVIDSSVVGYRLEGGTLLRFLLRPLEMIKALLLRTNSGGFTARNFDLMVIIVIAIGKSSLSRLCCRNVQRTLFESNLILSSCDRNKNFETSGNLLVQIKFHTYLCI